MYSAQKLLEMIDSERSSSRYDACEWLRVSQASSPEIIYALQKATHDSDPEVANRATYALQADVHHHQAVQMGLATPDERDRPAQVVKDEAIAESPPLSPAQLDQIAMLKDIRSWGWWSLVWGGLSLIASGIFNSPWGVLLVIVGLASFSFRTATMYVIYGVTLAWAALQNLTTVQGVWILFSLVQIYATVRVFLNFRRYHKSEMEILSSMSATSPETQPASRAARYFPWIGASLGMFSFAGTVFGFLLVMLITYERGSAGLVPRYIYYLIDLAINLGVLGFGLGLASILSHYRPRILGWLALTAGALTLLIDIGLIVLQFVSRSS
jgi:hypothetical protein